MGNLLSDGAEWLVGTLASHVSTSITYSRGASSVVIAATPGATELSLVDTAGFTTAFHSTDFIFRASALNFGAGVVEPAEGDVITFGGAEYEVLPVPGASHFRYGDPYRKQIRVHTKLVDT